MLPVNKIIADQFIMMSSTCSIVAIHNVSFIQVQKYEDFKELGSEGAVKVSTHYW